MEKKKRKAEAGQNNARAALSNSESISAASPPPFKKIERIKKTASCVSRFPPSLWASSLVYVGFRDVLRIGAVCKMFIAEVLPLVVKISILPDESRLLQTCDRALDRFKGVQAIFVYCAISELQEHPGKGRWVISSDDPDGNLMIPLDHPDRQLSLSTLENLPLFVTRFLFDSSSGESTALTDVWVGGMCTCENRRCVSWFNDGRRCDIKYNLTDRYRSQDDRLMSNAEHRLIYARFLQSVCHAYKGPWQKCTNGTPRIRGIIPHHRPLYEGGWGCLWPNQEGLLVGPCWVCELLCDSFPYQATLCWSQALVPCVTERERIKRVVAINRSAVVPKMTGLILHVLMNRVQESVLRLPPDYKRHVSALCYTEEALDAVQMYIEQGGNPKDPRCSEAIVGGLWEGCDPGEEVVGYNTGVSQHKSGLFCYSGSKRLLTVVTFERLKALGFDIEKGEVDLIDSTRDIKMRRFSRPAFDEFNNLS